MTSKHNSNFLCFWCIVLLSWCQTVIASDSLEIPEPPSNGAQAWLVTFGPGEIYWERFGHNALWLREPALGMDHTFNFGFFDFEQKDFFLRFIQGRMLYFSVAQPAQREFEFYRQQNRSIRVQKLDLDPVAYQRLRDYLLNEIKPENRDYRYDYYLNNCSTRIRDALDITLNGALLAATETLPASLNFRDQTRRLTQMDYWYYLGLEIGLGSPVDRPVSRWDEMFIPMVVADELALMPAPDSQQGQLLVSQDFLLFESSVPAPSVRPASVWFRYLALGLLVTLVAWLSGKFMPPVWLAGICNAWLFIGGTIGLILTTLWLFTDHQVARENVNILLFNPLFLLALIPVLNRFGAIILVIGVTASLLLLLLPSHQYNLNILALLAPLNLAVAGYFFKDSHR